MSGIRSDQINDSAIITAKIGDAQVTSGKIAALTATIGYSAAHSITTATQIVHKQYVDTAISAAVNGLDPKASVRAATTAALAANTAGGSGVGKTLTANANGALAAQDGVTLVVGNRLLVKNEATGANNGIYTVTQVGDGSNPYILTRATDADQDAEVTDGMYFQVGEGATYAGHFFILSTNDPITVDTTALTFVDFATFVSFVEGNGIDITGNTISVQADTTSTSAATANAIVVSANGVAISVDDSTIEGSEQAGAGAGSLRIKDLGVTTAKLAADAITQAKIADDAVQGEHLLDSAFKKKTHETNFHTVYTGTSGGGANTPVVGESVKDGTLLKEGIIVEVTSDTSWKIAQISGATKFTTADVLTPQTTATPKTLTITGESSRNDPDGTQTAFKIVPDGGTADKIILGSTTVMRNGVEQEQTTYTPTRAFECKLTQSSGSTGAYVTFGVAPAVGERIMVTAIQHAG